MSLLDGMKSRKLLKQGRAAQAQKNLEQAYALYEQAAALGNADAMVAIGVLYMRCGFRPVKASNLAALLLSGMPVMPWSMQEKLVPDVKTAVDWYRKAADIGHVEGMRILGTMLCEGKYCPQDVPRGLEYLKKAAAKGNSTARMTQLLYDQPERLNVPDDRYERWLTAFQQAADAHAASQYEWFARLKSGSDAQLARLGYVLTTALHAARPGYDKFPLPRTESGLPLIPVCIRRADWQTFAHIDLNAFPSPDSLIALTIDFGAENAFALCHRLTRAGTAVYRSPAFGWLGEEKHAVLLRIAPDAALAGEPLDETIRRFCLAPEEYEPAHAAFFTETGEKEYSAEIAAITGDRVDVLLRYTIGGSDHVETHFPPELISVHLD